MNSANRQNGLQFKKYNHLTAQIIRGTVRKKIYDIKKRGISAADEILDDMEKGLLKKLNLQENKEKPHQSSDMRVQKTDNFTGNGNQAIYNEIAETLAEGLDLFDKLKSNGLSKSDSISFEQLLLRMIRANRDAWRAFILDLATAHDAESLSCFGTDLIYGAFMTRSEGNSPRCVYFDLPGEVTGATLEKLKERLRKESSSGRRMCLIRGSGLLSAELLKIYHYYRDTAFILVDVGLNLPQISLPSLGIYNVMYVCDGRAAVDTKAIPLGRILSLKEVGATSLEGYSGKTDPDQRQNITQMHISAVQRAGGQGSDVRLTYGGASTDKTGISRLFYLLSAPKLPILLGFDEILRLICELEALVSENNNRAPITYGANNW